jgi:DNA polymerase-3 subunit alpha
VDRFVHLRVRSHLSLLAGGSSIEALMERARALGQPSLAITDLRSLHGAAQAEKVAKKTGVRLVLGCILPVQVGARIWAPTVLLRDAAGWRSMCRTLSHVAIDDRAPVPLDALLGLEPGGVFVLAGPAGGFFRTGDPLEPDVLRSMQDRFGAALHVELADTCPEHTETLPAARAWASAQGLPCVVTNDAHAVDAQGLVALEVLTRVAARSWLHDGRSRSTDQDTLKSRAELEQVFPDDAEALDRTLELAAQCDVRVGSKIFSFPRSEPPPELDATARWAWLAGWFPAPSGFNPAPPREVAQQEEGEAAVEDLPLYFGWFAREGLRVRFRAHPLLPAEAYHTRLEEEIRAIRAMGFAAYMLIVSEFTAWAKDNGVPVGPGRGSVAGSLVAWAMRITDVDPIRFGLFFERFLNPARVSIPDVDTDFGVVDRARVIAHVTERYGADRVGQIATYGTLAVKGAAKEAARVLGVRPLDAEEITRELEAARVGVEHATGILTERAEADDLKAREYDVRAGNIRETTAAPLTRLERAAREVAGEVSEARTVPLSLAFDPLPSAWSWSCSCRSSSRTRPSTPIGPIPTPRRS